MARAPKHLLLLEDDIAIRSRLRSWLEFEGYRVTDVDNVEEARQAFKSEDGPSLALIDLQVPEGFQLVQDVATLPESQQPTVIVMTDPEKRAHAVGCLKLGAADFLEKPITDNDLQKSIAAALKGPQPQRAKFARTESELIKSFRRDVAQKHYEAAHRLFEETSRTLGGEAAYYNLLGVLTESEGKLHAARAMYSKAAVWSGPAAKAARLNLERLDEIDERGDTLREPLLGDEDALVPAKGGEERSILSRLFSRK